MDWLQSQFAQPSDAIADMVNSVGKTHTLNAGDVLEWLGTLPESEARAAGMEKVWQQFPELRPGLPGQTVSVE